MTAKKFWFTIKDQVNVRIEGLEPQDRRRVVEALKFMVPYARHTPAFKMKRWDGKIAFASVGGDTYINLLTYVVPLIIQLGYDFDRDACVDKRPAQTFDWPTVTNELISDRVWQAGHPMEGEPIVLRDHQVRAIQTFLDNPQSVQEIATSAGKTIITGCLSMLAEPYGRTICVVPNKSLVVQTEKDYLNMGLDVGVFFGDRKEWGRTHTIATWQSLSIFAKKDRRGDIVGFDASFQEFLRDVVCVILDEAHSGKGKECKDLLTGPMAGIPLRYALTGTLPKEEFEFNALLAAFGPKVGSVTAKELQDKDIISDCHIDIFQLDDRHVEFKDYPNEYEWLCSDERRLAWVADYFQTKAPPGNTLILVERVVTGEVLKRLIPDAVFVDGSVKVKNRDLEYSEFTDDTNKIMIATYGVASTGINIPALHNVVLIEAGKSHRKVIQSVGRGLRKSKLKNFVNIFDICSNLKYSKKHLTERKRYYEDAQYPFDVKKISYR